MLGVLGAWQYSYDAAGNLVGQRDARNQATCLFYDALNRLTSKRYQTGVPDLNTFLAQGTCPVNAQQDVKYSYDSTSGGNVGVGRRTGMTDPSGSTSWTYDGRGRVTKDSRTIAGAAYDTLYTYDAMDRVETMTYPDGEQVRQSYNAATWPVELHSLTHTTDYEHCRRNRGHEHCDSVVYGWAVYERGGVGSDGHK